MPSEVSLNARNWLGQASYLSLGSANRSACDATHRRASPLAPQSGGPDRLTPSGEPMKNTSLRTALVRRRRSDLAPRAQPRAAATSAAAAAPPGRTSRRVPSPSPSGQAAGGSTDLIARALADGAAEDLGVADAGREQARRQRRARHQGGRRRAPDGQNLVLLNASLITITPLAVGEDEAVYIDDFEVITGLSQDDYVLVASPESGFETSRTCRRAAGRSTTAPPASAPAASSPRPCCSRRPRSTAPRCRSTPAPRR